jgi:bifunctional non-homologous end joining protein LigD
MHIPDPLPLGRLAEPFDHPDWLFELKHDGFRALAVIEQGQCRFISRNRHRLTGFDDVGRALVEEVRADRAILDGELAVIDPDGRSLFAAMMNGRHLARFFAFDAVWINETDLRQQPLIERKKELKRVLPRRSRYLLYVDHVHGTGKELYEWACAWDLEGIVAKKGHSKYEFSGGRNLNRSPWKKIKNPAYSQKDGHEELFERKRKIPTIADK